MDSPDITGPVLESFHHDLKRIHGFLGTFPTLERCIRADAKPVRRVIDIGCGGGALLDYLRKRLNVEVIGIDLKPSPSYGVPMIAANAATDLLPEADIAVSSLVAHHLTPDENIAVIRNVGRSCRRFIIHDLIRHPLPLVLFTVFLCPLIGRPAAVDGRQSIRRAFTPEEFAELTGKALAGSNAQFKVDVSRFLSRQIIDIAY
jgi:SAM-dependent methyltransferase